MKNIKIMLITFLLCASSPFVIASDSWSCEAIANDVSVLNSVYINENSENKLYIYAITPQQSSVFAPGVRVVLQLRSENCFDLNMQIKDSNNQLISKYLEKDRNNCRNHRSNSIYRPSFTFTLPDIPGEYTLEFYDDTNILLKSSKINLLDRQNSSLSVSHKKTCQVNNEEYEFSMIYSDPLIVGSKHTSDIIVRVSSNNPSKMNEILNELILVLSKRTATGNISTDNPIICNNSYCEKKYTVGSSHSSSAIIYLQRTRSDGGKVNVLSAGAVILDFEYLENMRTKLMDLERVSAGFYNHYEFINDSQKSRIWKQTNNVISVMIRDIDSLENDMSTVAFKNLINKHKSLMSETISNLRHIENV